MGHRLLADTVRALVFADLLAQQDAPQPPGKPNPEPDPPEEGPGGVEGPPPEDTEHDKHKPGRDPLRTAIVHRTSGLRRAALAFSSASASSQSDSASPAPEPRRK